MLHNFAESLAMSHAADELPFWEETYRKAFPTMIAMHNHRQDGQHQRNGIDRTVVLANSKTIAIDEKVRGTNRITGKVYKDIALEFLSDRDRKIPGWVCKPLLADYIAYAIAPIGKCYLLPVVQLQSAWDRNKEEWEALYPFVVESRNEYRGNRWVTCSRPIPVSVLFPAIGACLRVDFTPCEMEE